MHGEPANDGISRQESPCTQELRSEPIYMVSIWIVRI